MAFCFEDWEVVRAFFERGLTLSEIVARPECKITDKSTISRKARELGWVKGKKTTLVEKEVQAKQMLNDVVLEKATIKSTVELNIHNVLVLEATKQIEFLSNATMLNAAAMMRHIQIDDNNQPMPMESINDHRTIQATLKDAAMTVGVFKYPNATTVNNNAQASVGVAVNQMDDKDAIAEAQRIAKRLVN
jgi:hypothetical protein